MQEQQPDTTVLERRNLVKIDGFRQPDHALEAAQAGADLIGFIFATSKRQVSVNQARIAVDHVRGVLGDRAPLFVGVFVDSDAGAINRIASEAGLDLVQLHGSERVELLREVALPVIRAAAPPTGSSVDSVVTMLDSQRINSSVPALFLLDAYDPVQSGGSGRRADWVLASEVARRVDVMLAGGLTPENVAEAIFRVRPRGVDVSTGVETEGIKDPRKIGDFVANAKLAFSELSGMPNPQVETRG